jgi:thiamine biosynthesis lipoprotein
MFSPNQAAPFQSRWLGWFLRFAFFVATASLMTTPGWAAEPELFQFHHEGVLGTSLDLQMHATDAVQAEVVEKTVLEEIERLRKVLSMYDPESEISRFRT